METTSLASQSVRGFVSSATRILGPGHVAQLTRVSCLRTEARVKDTWPGGAGITRKRNAKCLTGRVKHDFSIFLYKWLSSLFCLPGCGGNSNSFKNQEKCVHRCGKFGSSDAGSFWFVKKTSIITSFYVIVKLRVRVKVKVKTRPWGRVCNGLAHPPPPPPPPLNFFELKTAN